MGSKPRSKHQAQSSLPNDDIISRLTINEIAFKQHIGLKCMLGYFIIILAVIPLMYMDLGNPFIWPNAFIYSLWMFPFIPMAFSYVYYERKIKNSYYRDKRDLLDDELTERLNLPENKKASGISKKIVFIIVCIFLSVLISKLVRLYR